MTKTVAHLRADGHTDWRAYGTPDLPPILAHALDAVVEQG